MGTIELEKYRKKIERAEMSCPRCGSNDIWKFGWVIDNSGRKQRWQCKSCGFRFLF